MMIMAVLARVVPRRRLLEMMLFGEKFDADEAARVGLVNRAVAPGELDAAVDAITDATRVEEPRRRSGSASRRSPRRTTSISRRALPHAPRPPRRAASRTDDAREGLMAFLEKRTPKWTGK